MCYLKGFKQSGKKYIYNNNSIFFFFFPRSRLSKRKISENASEMTKACIGFEDQNGKKVAVTVSTSLETYRTVASENSTSSSSTIVSSSNKSGAASRGNIGVVANKKLTNASAVGENVSQSSSVLRNVGKKRKGTVIFVIIRVVFYE